MIVIGQKSFALSPTLDTYMALTSGEFVRQINLTGNDAWSTLRVSMHCAFGDAGGTLATSLFVGFCSGTTRPFGSQSTTHAAGYLWGQPTAPQNWSYTANSGNSYYTGASMYGVRKVGGSVESASVGGASWCFMTDAGQRRGYISVQVNKAPTAVNPAGLTVNQSAAALDTSYGEFMYANTQSNLADMQIANATCAINGQGLAESVGWNSNALNCVDIYWMGIYPLYIYSIAVTATP